MNILVSGALAYDRIMNFPGYFKDHILPDKVHAISVSFFIDRLVEKRGGPGGNIAYSLRLLGEQALILATLGKDGGPYAEYLEKLGLPLAGVELHEDLLTAVASIITDKADNQIAGFYEGAMARQTTMSLSSCDSSSTLMIISPGNKEDMIRYGRECVARGIPYVFDPGQTAIRFSKEEILPLIKGAFSCIVNDYESSLIQKTTELSEDVLAEEVQYYITTLGENGSRIRFQNADISIPPCRVAQSLDPTGAGDAYRAGFLVAFLRQLSPEDMGRIASVAASYAVEQHGTQEHKWTIAEFSKRYEDAYGATCPL